MCILLYVKLIWCSGMHGSMVNLRRVHLPWIYVHSSICETDLVQWCCMDLWSIDGGSICIVYMCIPLYVKLIGVCLHSSICETY